METSPAPLPSSVEQALVDQDAVDQSAVDQSAVERIGRYARADLEAMHGKRGRKPPEYFQLFPERVRPAAPVRERPARVEAPAPIAFADHDPLLAQVRAASPAVRRLIADLLALVAEVPPAGASTVVAAEPVVSYDTSAAASSAVVSVDESSAMARPEPIYADPEADEQTLAG